MGKAFFITVFVIGLGGITCLFLNDLGVLPISLYSFAYGLEEHIPFVGTSVPPYLQKFEGNWSFALTSQSDQTELGGCTSSRGTLQMHDGIFSGNIGPFGSTVLVHASTTPDGVLVGTFNGTTVHMGTLQATIGNGQGSGTWSDNYNCSGTVTLTKQDPVVDPIRGKVVSANGGGMRIRDGASIVLYPGLLLYVGDEVDAGGTAVVLGLGSDFGTPVTVPPQGAYKVPAN